MTATTRRFAAHTNAANIDAQRKRELGHIHQGSDALGWSKDDYHYHLRQQTGGIGGPPDQQFHRPVRHRRALLNTGRIDVLFQGGVKIGAAKAKGTDPGTA